MPAPIIKSFAKKSGKSKSTVEKYYKRAKKLAAKQGHKEDYDYIMGILKRMLKINEDWERIKDLAGLNELRM